MGSERLIKDSKGGKEAGGERSMLVKKRTKRWPERDKNTQNKRVEER